jgi:hypothetical protein
MSERRMWPTPNATDGSRPFETPSQWRARQAQKKAANPNLGGLHRPLTLAVLEEGEPVTDVCQPSMFSAADFPASRTRPLVDAWAPPMTATSGPSTPDSFASLDPGGSWRKTSQGCCQLMLDGSLEAFSGTWPRAGMTRSGIAYLQAPLAPLTDATVSGSWPTPDANSGRRFGQHPNRINPDRTFTINDAVRCWPTPTVQDASNNAGSSQFDRNSLPLNAAVGGALNPTWVEWLMGYPLGWTDCGASATPSSRKSRSGSRTASSRRKVTG